MITMLVVRNPFNVDKKETVQLRYEKNKPISYYFNEEGNWIYSINGIEATIDDIVPEDGYIVIHSKVEGKAFGFILTIGLSVLTSGIASGAIFGGMNTVWRTVTALAIGMIGNAIVSKFTAVKPDMSNMEQSNTYGWDGARTLTGQGYVNAITYGRMKSGGMLLSRHITSDGEKQYLNLLYSAGEGPLDSIDHITINGNPLSNYKDVQVDIRYGTNDQDVIPNFNDNFADQQLSYELTEDWSIHQVQGNACQGLEITISLPQGLYYSNDDGGMDETYVRLEAQYRDLNNGTWNNFNGVGMIKDKQNKAIYRVYRIDNLTPSQYEVRVRCIGKEGKSIRYANRVYWAQLTQIVYDDFIHPGKALIGIKALATDQLSGNDPTVNWQQERESVLVFNPYAGAYERVKANNPAWVCYDMIHQCKLIEGEYIVKGQPCERMNYDRFKAWAKQCEDKGYEFNYIFDTAGQLWEQLKFPETIGRGKVLMQGTRFTCVYDYAAPPTQLFTVANIKKDSFKEDFQDIKNRANVVEISFMNKAKDYERDVLPVFSKDFDKEDSLNNPVQIELMGCTSLQQAYSHGKHHLKANKYEIRTCSFEAFEDAIACTIGDVILLQHSLPEWGHGGRIQAVEHKGNTTFITVEDDTQTDYSNDTSYKIMIRNNKTDDLREFNAAYHGDNVFKINDKIDVEVGCIYSVGTINSKAKMFRVLSITKGMNDTTRKITCMEYYPQLYENDDAYLPIDEVYTPKVGLQVKSLQLNKDVKTLKDGTVICDIIASWTLPRNTIAKQILVYYKRFNAKEWTLQSTLDGSATACIIPSVATNDSYAVRVVCIDGMGVTNQGVEAEVFIEGKETPPGDVQGFKVEQDNANSSILHISWQPNLEYDIQGYRLYNENGDELVHYTASNVYTYFIPTSGKYTFKIKALNRSGNLSNDFAIASIDAVVQAGSVEVPNAPDSGDVTLDGRSLKAVWDVVTNTYVDYYEVRTNTNVGNKRGLLAKTTDLMADIKLSSRKGTVYVYAHNPVKEYGKPLKIDYDFKSPGVPRFEVDVHFSGLNAIVENMGNNALGVIFFVTSDEGVVEIQSENGVLNYNGKEGIYSVAACFYDVFGRGNVSGSRHATIKLNLGEDALKNLKVTEDMLDQEIKNALNGAEQKADKIIASLNGDGSEYSAIAQLKQGLALKVSKGDVVSAINLAPDGVKIDGKYLQITGDTVFDKSVNVNNMITAKSIGADKLNVDKLSALTANIGLLRTRDRGARTEIKDNLIEVYDEDNNIRVKIGVWE